MMSQSKIAGLEELKSVGHDEMSFCCQAGVRREQKSKSARDRPPEQGLADQPGMTSTKPRAGSWCMSSGFTLRESVLPALVWSDATRVWPPLDQVCKQNFPFSAVCVHLCSPQHSSLPLHRDSTLSKGFQPAGSRHLVAAKSERRAAVSNFVVVVVVLWSHHFCHRSFQPTTVA